MEEPRKNQERTKEEPRKNQEPRMKSKWRTKEEPMNNLHDLEESASHPSLSPRGSAPSHDFHIITIIYHLYDLDESAA